MKNFLLLLSLLIVFSSLAQEEKLLINETFVSDLSLSPLYQRLVKKVDSAIVWKNKYKYIDSINISRISYLSDNLKINGYLVKPKASGNYPCIIYNRGGSGEFGALTDVHAAIFLGQLAKEGYIVIASQYRGNSGSEGKEEFGGSDIKDVTILTDVLKEVEGADANNIGMYGWSRGGMMTYIALTKTNKIKTVVVGGAVSDAYALIKDRPEMENEVFTELVPKYPQNKTKELNKRSAIKWANKFPKNTPVLILHGSSDWRVKSEQSIKIALKFQQYKVPYRLIIFEGGDHGISEHKKEVNQQVINWFNKYLKSNTPLPNTQYHGK